MAQTQINLMPVSYQQRLGDHRVRRQFIWYTIAAAVVLTVITVHLQLGITDRSEFKNDLILQVKTLDSLREQATQKHASADTLLHTISQYHQTAVPIEMSRVIATVSALLPEKISIDLMRLWVMKKKLPKSAMEALKDKISASRGSALSSDDTKRVLMAEFTGIAVTDYELSTFLAKLESNSLFNLVQMDYTKSIEYGSQSVREFRISFEVDLGVRYEIEPLVTFCGLDIEGASSVRVAEVDASDAEEINP